MKGSEAWMTVLIAAIAAIPPTVASLLAFLGARRNRTAIDEVHTSINGRMDQLLSTTEAVADAEGFERGQETPLTQHGE